MRGAAFEAFRVLVAPGLHGSGAAHWQSRWEALFPAFERIEQADWDDPDLHAWSRQVDVARARGDHRPVLIAAHSFGCLASVTSVARNPAGVAGLLLVAPADPAKFGLACAVPQRALPVRSTLLASSDDPWMASDRALHWARRWGSDFVDLGPLGHVNADSGLGDWPEGLHYLRKSGIFDFSNVSPETIP